jgi:hypothetical protein
VSEPTRTQIYYYVDNEPYAYRTRWAIPRVGDEVRFHGICYKVLLVVWIEDEKCDSENHIAIELGKIATTKKPERSKSKGR